MGKDVVYVLEAEQGDVLEFTYLQPDYDAAIYLVTDCSDVVNSCIAGVDRGVTGEPEHLIYGVPHDMTIYVILDTYGTDTGGAWTLDYGITCCARQACCLPDGSCRMECTDDCLLLGGTPMGDGTDCVTSDCGVPVESVTWGRVKNIYR